MRFLIIDDDGGYLDSLIFVLNQCYPGCEIAPDRGRTTKRWRDAESLVLKAANEQEQIIFLDLALDASAPDAASAGLHRVTNLFTRCPEATWIAYTSYAEMLGMSQARALFHNILDKQQLSQKQTWEEKGRLVRRVIEEAARKRQEPAQSEPVKHEDSAGMRSFLSIYRKDALEELIAAECSGWTDYAVSALSSGYSGSSLLQIVGKKDSASGQIVVKLAPRREIIERETHVHGKYIGEGGEYVGKCAQPSPIKDHPNQMGFYSIQESVPGRTLMRL
jgi:hypothetical protein